MSEKEIEEKNNQLRNLSEKPFNERLEIIHKYFGPNIPRIYAESLYYDQPNYPQITGSRKSYDINRFDDLDTKDEKILKIAINAIPPGKLKKEQKEEQKERLKQLEEMGFTKSDYIIYYNKKNKK